MAHVRQARDGEQHRHCSAAAEMPGVKRGGKRLAVHARQLALKPRVHLLRNIVDHCCTAWNGLQPWHIITIVLRDLVQRP